MPHIRIIAAAVAATALALAFMPGNASARGCGDDKIRPKCETAVNPESNPGSSPAQLDQFMKTWQPVAVSKHKKRTRTAHRKRAVKEASAKPAKTESEEPVEPAKKVAAAEPVQAVAAEAQAPDATAQPAAETEGVTVTSFNELNEIDAALEPVQVVAANEVNQIDAAAPAVPVAAETVAQAASADDPESNNSWIGKLLLAFAGTIALAGATRFMVA